MFQKIKVWIVGKAIKALIAGKPNGVLIKVVTARLESELKKWEAHMNLKGSWQPKALGALGLLIALANAGKALLDGDPGTNIDVTSIMAQITTCIALFTVRQDNKSSEQVGAGNIPPK